MAWAAASVAWADTTDAFSWVGSRDATVCPAVTVEPTDTSTAPIVPDVAKASPAWFTGATVPTESSVASTVLVRTTVVR